MATRHDLIIDQGADFEVDINLYDSNGDPDLTEYTATGKLKKSYFSNTSVAFSCNVDSGVLTVSMDHVTTANVTPGRYVYDVNLFDSTGNTVTRIVEGIVTVSPEITK